MTLTVLTRHCDTSRMNDEFIEHGILSLPRTVGDVSLPCAGARARGWWAAGGTLPVRHGMLYTHSPATHRTRSKATTVTNHSKCSTSYMPPATAQTNKHIYIFTMYVHCLYRKCHRVTSLSASPRYQLILKTLDTRKYKASVTLEI